MSGSATRSSATRASRLRGRSSDARRSRQQECAHAACRVAAAAGRRQLISRDVRDPRVGSVTITSVEVAPDMSVAKVYFVPFGAAHGIDEVAEGLSRAASFLRGEVGRRLGLRHAPRLDFRYDDHDRTWIGAQCADQFRRAGRQRARAQPEPGAATDQDAAPGRRRRTNRQRAEGAARARDARRGPERHPAARQTAGAVIPFRDAAGQTPAGRYACGSRRQPRSAGDRHAADLCRRATKIAGQIVEGAKVYEFDVLLGSRVDR
ncbi:MAG: 30S ribosome-binding factor RbfA [Steroidobacteraceae bacterium]